MLEVSVTAGEAPYESLYNLSMAPLNFQQQQQTYKTEIISAKDPILLKIDSPTDWPVAVVTPIVIALAAAWFAFVNQRFQIRSTTANFRHSWQIELRSAVTSYIGTALEINMKCLRDVNFLNKPEAEPLISKLATSRAMIRVMLDKNKNYTNEIVKLMDQISDNLDDRGSIFDEKITEFANKSQEVLEVAWGDIRRDLLGKKK